MLDVSLLPALDPEVGAFLSSLSMRRDALGVDIAGEPAEIVHDDRSEKVWRASAPLMDLALPISSEIGDFTLWVERRMIDDLSDAVLPGWRSEVTAALPLLWRALVVAEALAGQTAAHAFDWRLRSGDESADAKEPGAETAEDARRFATTPMRLEWRGESYRFAIEINDAPDVERLRAVSPEPPADIAPALTVVAPVSVSLARVTLTAAAAARVAVGDVLLPPGAELPRLRATAALPGPFAWAGFLSDTGAFEFHSRLRKDQIMKDHVMEEDDLSVTAAFDDGGLRREDAHDPFQEEGGAPKSDPAKVDTIALGEEDLAAVTVELEIRLGAVSTPLSAFAKLAPGAVVDLGVDLSAPVQILGNGRVVGAGALVRLEDRVGVQIERWGGAGAKRDV